MATSEALGNVEALPQEVDAHENVENPRRKSRMISDALDGLHVGVDGSGP
jgi:hypothetical protein